MTDELGPWVPLDPVEVRHLLRNYGRPWWIGGGWAIDMFLGRKTRDHDDIDVGFLLRDALEVQALFAGWDLHWAASGRLVPWAAGELPEPERHGVWARPGPDRAWAVDLAFNPGDDRTWVYRRNPAITRPLDEVVRHTGDGIPYLAPEVQLLFKSKGLRPKDHADFDNVWPRLDDEQRAWLTAVLPDGHPWRR